MTFDSLMNKQCYIGTRASSSNYLGDFTYSWTYSTSPTKCRLQPIGLSDRVDFPGEWQDIRYRGYFKSGAGVNLGNQIKYNNQIYTVRERYMDSSDHHITTLLAKT